MSLKFLQRSLHRILNTLKIYQKFSIKINRNNKIGKINSHITRLFNIESYKVFLPLKFCIITYLMKTKPW